ncbi:HEPN domain-containing protein [Azohydromonas aeria]|uniref:HEPN domain-containing protein n=1 Tax=Azohydromonas aeria TaxID=2590212 RepID=UPI0012F7AD13|nr:HEPN domain-containing protein [Azohydromonas aeria]
MVSTLLEAARRDAVVFFKLVDDVEVHDSMLGFHAQQAIEKALKAVLSRHGVLVPRTHRIDQLLDVFQDGALPLPPHAQNLDEFNPYAVQARYGALDTGPLDRLLAAEWLKDVMDWAQAAAGQHGASDA